MTVRIPARSGWFVAALLAAAASPPASAQRPRLSVSRSTISPGESVTVSWSALRGDSVFISGLGARGPTGEASLVPRVSTRFVLYVLTPSGVETAADSVEVRGAPKGDEDLPDSFDTPRRYRVRAHSFAWLLEHIDDVLQHRLGYPAPLTSLNSPTLTTAYRQRPDLVRRGEPIVMRWLAFRVTVAPSMAEPGLFECFISTSIRYQRGVEARVRLQPPGDMNAREEARLAGIIGA